jgi:fido (protein-threonine AMPylation protein)
VPDWEKDSLRLNNNLVAALKLAAYAAERREIPTLTAARNWHKRINRGLVVPRARFVGAFRGEPGLERIHVRVRSRYGAKPADVAKELSEFEAKLQAIVSELDASLPSHVRLSQDHLGAVLDVCAWVHSEWVRIHPFVNGNGRTARIWANSIAMRYGLPPFLPLRPRPGARYAAASAKAMQGDWSLAAVLFRELLDDLLGNV